jgi:hypothetical protein
MEKINGIVNLAGQRRVKSLPDFRSKPGAYSLRIFKPNCPEVETGQVGLRSSILGNCVATLPTGRIVEIGKWLFKPGDRVSTHQKGN